MNKGKVIFILFVFLSSNQFFCQNQSYCAEYGITLHERKGILSKESFENLIANIDEKLKQMSFDLKFDNQNAKFSLNKNSLNENENFLVSDFAYMSIGTVMHTKFNCDTIFTKNNKFKNRHENKYFYTIVKHKWFITSQKKIINGYQCTKAVDVSKIELNSSVVDNYDGYVAWFCPDIKSSFGPKGFMGLPGLIIQLESPIGVFLTMKEISKIDLNESLLPENNSLISEDLWYGY